VGVRSDAKLAGWLAFIGVFAALNYSARFADGETRDDYLYLWSTAVLGVVQFLVTLGVVLLIARGLPLRETLALRRPESWSTAASLALGSFLAILVLSAALSPLLNPGKEQGLVPDQWEPQHAGAFAANAVVVIVLAPVVEELTFRGLGFALLLRLGTWSAIVGTALAFALVHGLVEAFPILAAFGIALAYLRSRTDSIFPSMLLHACFNAAALAAALLT
jgi:membrane protease YdiL (CAAX protease family)